MPRAHLREGRQQLKHEVRCLDYTVADRQVADPRRHIVAAGSREQYGREVDLGGVQLAQESDDIETVEARVDDQQIGP